MDHVMHGAELFTHEKRFEWRMEYFATLMTFNLERVGTVYISSI
jgi:hypothetical protein